MTSGDIKALLSIKYAPPAYAFFTEVGTSTGAAARYIDAVAYSLYQSMGHEIHGFEIKISRSDFLQELKNPQKSQDAMQYCHRWWMVAPKGIIDKNEIPKDWGFIEVVNNKLFKRKHAAELKPEYSPAFIAACLRRSTEGVIPRDTLYQRCEIARREARDEYAKEINNIQEKLDKYKKQVAIFEKASGISILDNWRRPEELGQAIEFIISGGFRRFDYNFEEMQKDLDGIKDTLKKLSKFSKIELK